MRIPQHYPVFRPHSMNKTSVLTNASSGVNSCGGGERSREYEHEDLPARKRCLVLHHSRFPRILSWTFCQEGGLVEWESLSFESRIYDRKEKLGNRVFLLILCPLELRKEGWNIYYCTSVEALTARVTMPMFLLVCMCVLPQVALFTDGNYERQSATKLLCTAIRLPARRHTETKEIFFASRDLR